MSATGELPTIAIFLPTLRGGGAERVCIYLANAFAARGLTVDMVLMQAEGELLPLLDPRVRIVALGVSRVRSIPGPLMRYLLEHRPAAVLANMWPLTMIAVAVARLIRSKTKVVVVEHTNWSASLPTLRWPHRLAFLLSMRVLMPRADSRVGVSSGVSQDLEAIAAMPGGSVRTIYNPVVGGQTSGTLPANSPGVARWLEGDHKRVIAVGTLKAVKRFDVLIEAFARLAGENVRLLILGEGAERATLETLAEQRGVRNRIEMPGFITDPAPMLRKADLFVLSSDFEGFGNVVVEALEQGTPVVSTDCPSGPSEILEGGRYGTLVRVGDIDGLAHAMHEALFRTHDPDALRRRARDFGVDRAADQYLDLLLPGWRSTETARTWVREDVK